MASGPAFAHIATISGSYDDTSHGEPYDTPELFFNNSSGFDFTNVSITAVGYQPGTTSFGLNQTRNLPNIGAGTTYEYVWLEGYGGTIQNDLFSYDYDDSNGVYYNAVGNFKIVFNATWNGQAISSVFSPTVNVTGGFVGWEGLDPGGFAETAYDAHSGTPGGVLAYIDLGKAAVPEPATWAIMLIGFGALGGQLRSRRQATVRAG
jgi:hypothetical protein